jgi:hypothetical protein
MEHGLMVRSARLSPCGTYRYILRREWHPIIRCLGDDRVLVFLLLNPTTADHKEDDPTTRRCVEFARRDGYNAIHIVNLFAFRCPSPSELCMADDPIGPENDACIRAACAAGSRFVAGWGSNHWARGRLGRVGSILADLSFCCLGINGDGSPKHPLYVPGNTQFEPYSFPQPGEQPGPLNAQKHKSAKEGRGVS